MKRGLVDLRHQLRCTSSQRRKESMTAVQEYVTSFISSCDYHMSPFEMEGNMVVENPFGKMPAPQYGSLPFFSFMCLAYVIALIVWSMLCISYSKEVMSVQVIILVRM